MPGEVDRPRLKRIRIEGFRSIASAEIAFTDLDVLIGANGAGKSNLIAFLRMVGFMLSSEGGLSLYVGRMGGASALLHDGPKVTRAIEAEIVVETSAGVSAYAFRLELADQDRLIFAREEFKTSRRDQDGEQARVSFGHGHAAPGLPQAGDDPAGEAQRTALDLLRGLVAFHFHDTSAEAPMKRKARVDDGHRLRSDGGNLAAFLLHMRRVSPAYHRRIVATLRLFAPFFDDFAIEDDQGYALLRWREVGSAETFGPGQMSDGMLRATALLALLLQPAATMPPVVVIDEPELGLHPAVLNSMIGIVRAAALSRQCILATQSPAFLTALDAGSVVVVDRVARASAFRRLDLGKLEAWLDDYDLVDLWDMNLLGGRPGSLAAE